MINAQGSMFNEYAMQQCSNAFIHLIIEHSLPAEHCALNIGGS